MMFLDKSIASQKTSSRPVLVTLNQGGEITGTATLHRNKHDRRYHVVRSHSSIALERLKPWTRTPAALVQIFYSTT